MLEYSLNNYGKMQDVPQSIYFPITLLDSACFSCITLFETVTPEFITVSSAA